MITLITGAPGAGKTAAMVDLIKGWADKGRAIYVDGVPDLAVPHLPLEAPRRWHEAGEVEDGSALVIDEVQRIWRPAGSGSAVPPDIQALETHRHRGLDFILITQHPSMVHQNVRRLVGRHVHLRDVGLLGRWWCEWPEASDPQQFRNAPVKRKYSLPKHAFGLYKSASLHVKPVRSIPRTVVILGLAVAGLGYLGWRAYKSIDAKTAAIQKPAIAAAAAASAPRPAPGGVIPGRRVLEVSQAVANREPFGGLGVHLAGLMVDGATRHAWFYLSQGGRVVATLADKEVLAAGYGWRYLAPCSVVLIFGEKERFVTCDAPLAVPLAPGRPASAAGSPADVA